MKDLINDSPLVNDLEEALPIPEIKTQKYQALSEIAAEYLANGGGYKGTAVMLGIHPETLRNWMGTIHFSCLYEAKKEELRQELIGNIKNAGKQPQFWAANMTFLERNKKVFGDEYSQPGKGNSGVNVVVNVGIAHPGKSADKRKPTLKITDSGDE
jgi:hypothetical protein